MGSPNDRKSRQGLACLLLAVTLFWAEAALAAAKEPTIPKQAPLTTWYSNGAHGVYVLNLFEGVPPLAQHQLEGVVLSDANCMPDANGLSHCHNRIGMVDGRQITVINNHQMSRYGCLKPGDRLSFVALNGQWLVGRLVQ